MLSEQQIEEYFSSVMLLTYGVEFTLKLAKQVVDKNLSNVSGGKLEAGRQAGSTTVFNSSALLISIDRGYK